MIFAAAQCLKHSGVYDADGGYEEAEADDAQCGAARTDQSGVINK